jgi:ABC-2 type transport system ATP-binding protein
MPSSTSSLRRERPAVEIAALTVVRGGRHALRDVTLTISSGTVTGLIGPSGCGKTTLMRAILGVQVIAAGDVTVLGLPAGAPRLRSRVGYVTQAPAVYGDLTVVENLRYFAAVMRTPRSRIDELIGELRLMPLREQLAATLSGGELARLSLATAMLPDPELLVLDEPTVGLDPLLRAETWARFRALAERGTTIVVSSHQAEDARECHSLVVMRDGAVVEQTTPDTLRARTHQPELDRALEATMREAAA